MSCWSIEIRLKGTRLEPYAEAIVAALVLRLRQTWHGIPYGKVAGGIREVGRLAGVPRRLWYLLFAVMRVRSCGTYRHTVLYYPFVHDPRKPVPPDEMF